MKSAIRNVEYGNASIKDFQIVGGDDQGKVNRIEVDNRVVVPTQRFWSSLCSTYSTHGLSTKLFKLFEHDEVFTRLVDRLGGNGKDRLRYAVETPENGLPRLLAVSNPTKPLMEYSSIGATMERYAAQGAEYKDGVVRSTHTPAHMDDFVVGKDEFSHRYVMEVPVDGYGKPLIYLSLLRQVCSNGSIGYARAFRSEVSLGTGSDNPVFTLERALDSFSNEEGYAALRERFESAQSSWASLAECHKVYTTITKMAESRMFKSPTGYGGGSIDHLDMQRSAVLKSRTHVNLTLSDAPQKDSAVNIKLLRAFTQMTGELAGLYDLTHIDALSRKKQAQLSSKASMYDLINFCTEAATHYCGEKDGRLLQAEVGNFISNEYDLEGTMVDRPNFTDWFVKPDPNNN